MFSYEVEVNTASTLDVSELYLIAPVVAAGTCPLTEEAGHCASVPFGSTNCPESFMKSESVVSQ